jgi:hypothetical protein
MREQASSRSIVSNTPVTTNTSPDKQFGLPCESTHGSVTDQYCHTEQRQLPSPVSNTTLWKLGGNIPTQLNPLLDRWPL